MATIFQNIRGLYCVSSCIFAHFSPKFSQNSSYVLHQNTVVLFWQIDAQKDEEEGGLSLKIRNAVTSCRYGVFARCSARVRVNGDTSARGGKSHNLGTARQLRGSLVVESFCCEASRISLALRQTMHLITS